MTYIGIAAMIFANAIFFQKDKVIILFPAPPSPITATVGLDCDNNFPGIANVIIIV